MEQLIADFENVKISALSKSKSINKYIHNVTIGPNSTFFEEVKIEIPEIQKKKTQTTNRSSSSPNAKATNNKRTSIGKILTEIEAQVKDEVELNVRSRLEKIEDASKKLKARFNLEWLEKQESLIAQSQKQEELMMNILEEHDRKSSDHMQQLQLQYQKQAEERNKRNMELQKKEEEQRKLLQIIELIQKLQHEFRMEYQDIVIILKEYNTPNILNDAAKVATLTSISQKLKQYVEIIDKIKDKCKMFTVTTTDINIATNIVKDVSKLKENLQILLAKKKEEEGRQLELKNNPPQQQIEIKQHITSPPTATSKDVPDTSHISIPLNLPNNSQQQEQKENVIENSTNEVVPTASLIHSFGNKDALKLYSNLQQYLENYKNSYSQLINDPRMKQFRFHCKKAVNSPLNAISSVNMPHMLDKYHKLSNLLRGNTVETGGTSVTSSEHPQGIAFCTDLLARKFVQQGDLLVSSNPDTAHCYAAVLIALWHDFPDFGILVLAYFFLTVPYLLPFYPPRISDQSDQDYYISLGYNYNDGVVEKQDKFLKRMSGTMRLYAALTISKLKRGQQGSHPHGLIFAWKWISNILNIEPRSDITAQLIFDFLEVTGSTMQAAYGSEFQKLLIFINDVYLEKMQKIDSGGPVSRLEVLLQKIKKIGQIDPAKGRLPEGFW